MSSSSDEPAVDEWSLASGEVDVGEEPIGRKGCCSVVHGGKLYLLGGFPIPHPREIDVLDFETNRWSTLRTDNFGPLRAGGCCTVIQDTVYTFGGWFTGARHADIHELDLNQLKWSVVPINNGDQGPMCKDKAGMVAYGEEMLCVMGGFGHFGDVTSDKVGGAQKSAQYDVWDLGSRGGYEYWTNELHLFHIPTGMWCSPELSGSRPPPCAAFSFTRVDRHRVVLFGGRQQKERVNHVYILDMNKWHWSGPVQTAGDTPIQRSVHSACSLVDSSLIVASHEGHLSSHQPGVHAWLPCATPTLLQGEEEDLERGLGSGKVEPKMLVAWGMDNNEAAVADMWILNISQLTWQKVSCSRLCGPPRIWGNMAAYHPTPYETVVVATGGTRDSLDSCYIHRASLLHFGLQTSLYYLCLCFLANKLDVQLASDLLPASVLKDLSRTAEKLKNARKHFKYSCSL